MTPDLPPWLKSSGSDCEAAKKKTEVSVFVKTVALGKWSDALLSAELQPCAGRPAAGWECTVNWEGGSRNWELRNFMHGWQ